MKQFFKDYKLDIAVAIGVIAGPFIVVGWLKLMKAWISLLGI